MLRNCYNYTELLQVSLHYANLNFSFQTFLSLNFIATFLFVPNSTVKVFEEVISSIYKDTVYVMACLSERNDKYITVFLKNKEI